MKSGKKQQQQQPYTSEINERYYALDNQPNYNQLKGKAHFRDDEGREYTIAVENKQIFQNERLIYHKDGENDVEKNCIINNYGDVTLYVRLTKGSTSWFDGKSIKKPIVLYRIDNDNYSYYVILRSAFKYNQSRLTGTVTIGELDPNLCRELLNKKI